MHRTTQVTMSREEVHRAIAKAAGATWSDTTNVDLIVEDGRVKGAMVKVESTIVDPSESIES